MNFLELGKTDIYISQIIMGTWQAGKNMWADIDDTKISRALRDSLNGGINTFDTAEVYGNGYSEQVIGKALKEVRHEAVFATKVFCNHLKYDQVIQACHRSLRNLKTDYIDLYQIHWPSGTFKTQDVPIEETMRAMNDLAKDGKIRSIGVSNFNIDQLAEACKFGEIVSLQPPYSLFWRSAEEDLIPYCVGNNIAILAYSSMAQGFLTGKFALDHKFQKGDHRAKNRLFHPELFKHVQKAVNELRLIADQYGVTLAQLALAWVISHPFTTAIAGARNSEQILENIKSVNIKLSDDDLSKMDGISRIVTDHLNDDPVMWTW